MIQAPGDDAAAARRRLVAAVAATVLLGVLSWDAPRVLGSEAGRTSCLVLSVSAGTLAGLLMSKPRRWSVAVGVVAATAVALACLTSAFHVGHGEF